MGRGGISPPVPVVAAEEEEGKDLFRHLPFVGAGPTNLHIFFAMVMVRGS